MTRTSETPASGNVRRYHGVRRLLRVDQVLAWRLGVDQAAQLLDRLRLGDERDHDARPRCRPRTRRRPRRTPRPGRRCAIRPGAQGAERVLAEEGDRRPRHAVPATRPTQPAVGRHPLPEHTEDERGEQRCVEEPEQHLQVVHDVREVARQGRGEDGDHGGRDRRDPADHQVVVVGSVLDDVLLPEVVAEHGVEGRDVGGHAGHERRQQAGDRQPEQAVRQDVAHQVEQRVVVGDALSRRAAWHRLARS